jgi:hypothetical protein
MLPTGSCWSLEAVSTLQYDAVALENTY